MCFENTCFQIFRFKGFLKAAHVVMEEGAHDLYSKKHGCYFFDSFFNLWLAVFVISKYILNIIYIPIIYIYIYISIAKHTQTIHTYIHTYIRTYIYNPD
jgi:hypothetical protein